MFLEFAEKFPGWAGIEPACFRDACNPPPFLASPVTVLRLPGLPQPPFSLVAYVARFDGDPYPTYGDSERSVAPDTGSGLAPHL